MPCAFELLHISRDTGGCQFDMPEGALIEHDSQPWCQFHLPLDAKTAWDEERIEAFNQQVFDWIDAAKKENRTADLCGVVFRGKVSFSHYKSAKAALPPILFIAAHFAGEANFRHAHFAGYADFQQAQFAWYSYFDDAQFTENANFRQAQFAKRANFQQAQFAEVAYFRQAQFAEVAYFWQAQFAGLADFNDARFGRYTNFSHAQFARNADFTGAADDAGAADFKFVDFSDAIFGGKAAFDNRIFKEPADFRHAAFRGKAPTFHNAKLHQGTDFTNAVFADRSGAAAPAYRTLKLAMEDMRARDEEAKFYALEMECRRKQADTPATAKFLSYLYDWGSDYGQSVTRPLVWLGVTGLLCWMLYMTMAVELGLRDGPACLSFTLEQIFRPFFIWSANYQAAAGGWVAAALQTMPLGLKMLATVQSLVSFGLVTLFLLAVRRRFRMA